MRRGLGEYAIGGVASTIPFHQAVLAHPVFVEGRASTDWIERDGIGRDLAPTALPPATEEDAPPQERAYTLEVNGKRFGVKLFGLAGSAEPNGAGPQAAPRRPRPQAKGGKGAAGGNGVLNSPIQGTILRVAVAAGGEVKAGDLVCVIEAMKMENEITAPRDGTVRELAIAAGQTVKIGERLATIG